MDEQELMMRVFFLHRETMRLRRLVAISLAASAGLTYILVGVLVYLAAGLDAVRWYNVGMAVVVLAAAVYAGVQVFHGQRLMRQAEKDFADEVRRMTGEG